MQVNGRSSPAAFTGGERKRDFLVELKPRRRLEDMVLSDVTRRACSELIEEQHRASVLRAQSLEPRHRVLLVGPPGNGKTSLAEAIAESLAVPFFVVRYEAMVGSFLGETATRLKHVFDYVRTTPCVLFFDEFDAVGKERGDIHETGEIKRVVSSLLMQVDDLPSYAVVLAATNHAELLDRAVWRRFQIRLTMDAPRRAQLTAYLERFAASLPEPLGRTPTTIARRLGPHQLRRSRGVLPRHPPPECAGDGRTEAERHCRRAARSVGVAITGTHRHGGHGWRSSRCCRSRRLIRRDVPMGRVGGAIRGYRRGHAKANDLDPCFDACGTTLARIGFTN